DRVPILAGSCAAGPGRQPCLLMVALYEHDAYKLAAQFPHIVRVRGGDRDRFSRLQCRGRDHGVDRVLVTMPKKVNGAPAISSLTGSTLSRERHHARR